MKETRITSVRTAAELALGWFVALVFLYYGAHVSFHLISETHLHRAIHQAIYFQGEHDHRHHNHSGNDAEEDRHQPHSASDHLLRFAFNHHALDLAFDAAIVKTEIPLPQLGVWPETTIQAAWRPPAHPPPGPSQPRAPPPTA